MKSTALSIAMFVVIFIPGSPAAAQYSYSAPELSGSATNALVRAYGASGLDGETPPPFRLAPYIVRIQVAGAYFRVTFLGQTTVAVRDVIVGGTTGVTISAVGHLHLVQMPTEGLVLPGVVAGEIMVAHREAVIDGFRQLKTGGYNLLLEPFAGGCGIGFIPLNEVPNSLSTRAAPTPLPSPRCSAVACIGQLSYVVKVRDQRITIRRAGAL